MKHNYSFFIGRKIVFYFVSVSPNSTTPVSHSDKKHTEMGHVLLSTPLLSHFVALRWGYFFSPYISDNLTHYNFPFEM